MDLNSEDTLSNICFVLPTYNEAGNIKNIIDQIFHQHSDQLASNFSILVVDDNSSDQTQEIVKDIIKANDSVDLITGNKRGLGDAYKRGFKYALDHLNADVIFQMDSDGQHDASLIPIFLEEINKGRDVAVSYTHLRAHET